MIFRDEEGNALDVNDLDECATIIIPLNLNEETRRKRDEQGKLLRW